MSPGDNDRPPRQRPPQILFQRTDQPKGATIKPLYAERVVTTYAVSDSEVQQLSYLNTHATVMFSVGSGLLTLGVGILSSAAFAEKLTPAGQFATAVGAPLICVLSLVFFILGGIAAWKRRTTWTAIKSESTTAESEKK